MLQVKEVVGPLGLPFVSDVRAYGSMAIVRRFC